MARNWFSRRITFELGFGIPLAIAAIGLCAGYIFLPDSRGEFTFVALVLGGAAALYSAFYAGAATRECAHRERMRNTFELIRAVDEPELIRLREVLAQAIDHKKVAPDDVLTTINETLELRVAARGLLNAIEDIAVAIRLGYADERVVHAAMGSLMCGTADKYAAFIQGERDRHGKQTIYRELERVSGSWKGRKYHTLDGEIPNDPCESIRRR